MFDPPPVRPGALHVTTEPVAEPISLADAKAHLRVETADEDAKIAAELSAAREYCEHYTGRAFAARTVELALDSFYGDAIELPLAPVTAITSVTYIDADGVTRTLSSGAYMLDVNADPARLSWAAGTTQWPPTKAIANAVRVRYTVGHTIGAGRQLPYVARAAILITLADLHENPQSIVVGQTNDISLGAKALLDTIKLRKGMA